MEDHRPLCFLADGDERSLLVFDIILAGGDVIDGTGAAAVCADVGITGELISDIGDLRAAETARRIDVHGLVVCPGFIDIHTHMDSSIESLSHADNWLRQGVTTCIGGNCGGGTVPVGPNLEMVEELEIRTNYAALVGCNAVRAAVLNEERPASDDEIREMTYRVREGFEDGAVGLSSGVRYLPCLTTGELIEMSKVAADYDSFYASHIRNEGKDLMKSIEELVEIVRRSGAAGQVSHIKCLGKRSWHQSEKALELITNARDVEGLDVTADQYPYTGCMNSLDGALFGQATKSRANKAGGLQTLLEPGLRSEAEANFREAFENYDNGHSVLLSPGRSHPAFDFGGRTLAEYLEANGAEPFEGTLDLCLAGPVSGVYLVMCEEDVCTYMRSELVMTGSDAMLRTMEGGFTHPRCFGTFPRVLARYVREKKVIGLEAAVRKMTGLPARRLGFKKRGRLAKGMIADITVFSPDNVADTATFKNSNSYPKGIEHVLLAGKPAVENGSTSPSCCGTVLRRGES